MSRRQPDASCDQREARANVACGIRGAVQIRQSAALYAGILERMNIQEICADADCSCPASVKLTWKYLISGLTGP
jgi:hypothetical protein